MADYTPEEMMTIEAARTFRNGTVCFVGVGAPSVAAVLARNLHAPDIVLVYESGLIAPSPTVAPLSIADTELAETAEFVVSVPEMFSYWLQGGRIDAGYLGAGQIDRFANLNSTVIGNYGAPKVRMPGAGGAPEIAAHAGEIIVIVRHSQRSFVADLDFTTTVGYATGGNSRSDLGHRGAGPRRVITDLGVLEPGPIDRELTLTGIYAGVAVNDVYAATGWPLRISDRVREICPPRSDELSALRDLNERTLRKHA